MDHKKDKSHESLCFEVAEGFHSLDALHEGHNTVKKASKYVAEKV
jgi:hypothetical protein